MPVRSVLPQKTPGMSRKESLARKETLDRYVDGVRTGQVRAIPVPGVTLRSVGAVHAQVEQLPAVLVDTLPSVPCDDAVVVLDAAMAGRYEFGRKVADEHLDAAEILMGGGAGEDRWRFLRSFCDERSESPGESLSRLRIEQLGFVAPELQKVVHLPGQGKARLDFFWEGSGVVGEFDGRIKYSRAQQLSGRSADAVVYEEKLREDALRAAGFSVVRWTWDELKEPEAFGRKLLAAGVAHREIQRSFVTLSPGQRLRRFP